MHLLCVGDVRPGLAVTYFADCCLGHTVDSCEHYARLLAGSNGFHGRVIQLCTMILAIRRAFDMCPASSMPDVAHILFGEAVARRKIDASVTACSDGQNNFGGYSLF